jgi:hypothetical protein
MSNPARKPLPIDFEESHLWAIESLSSVGVSWGPVGVGLGLFDLVNRETGRAHKMALKSGGIGRSFSSIPISGSFTASGYENFETRKDVSFKDFDRVPMRVTDVSIGLYSWDTVNLLGSSIQLDSSGLSIPTLGTVVGMTEILYGDGRPEDSPDLVYRIPFNPKNSPTIKQEVYYKRDDADISVYSIESDVLFAFDKYRLKDDQRTYDALGRMGGTLATQIPTGGF